jgi:translation initiation factor 2 beta subunit (eIF-2beta)/eIF-5
MSTLSNNIMDATPRFSYDISSSDYLIERFYDQLALRKSSLIITPLKPLNLDVTFANTKLIINNFYDAIFSVTFRPTELVISDSDSDEIKESKNVAFNEIIKTNIENAKCFIESESGHTASITEKNELKINGVVKKRADLITTYYHKFVSNMLRCNCGSLCTVYKRDDRITKLYCMECMSSRPIKLRK